MKNKKLYILFRLLATTVAVATDIKRKACVNKPNNSRIHLIKKKKREEARHLIIKQACRAATRLHMRATPSSRDPATDATHTDTHAKRSIGFRK